MRDTTRHPPTACGLAELLSAAPAVLHAEFEAIVAANFQRLRPLPGTRLATTGPRRENPGSARGPGTLGAPRKVAHGPRGLRRQRSPPPGTPYPFDEPR
ncbi:hypothetical protein ACPZ19_21915 [Amycolatopsis lurida]